MFRKHVKPKKQHELVRMAAVSDVLSSSAAAAADSSSCDRLIDIGSGVGHLARLLSYGRGK